LVLIAGFDHLIIADRSARLRDIPHAAAPRPLDVVPKREEGV
jgi:hypothetical protein